MKQTSISIVAIVALLCSSAFITITHKYSSQKTHISFFSHTDIEDISANNYKAVSTLDQNTGDVVFSVPMQSFEFKKALMQKHYNSSKFLDTKKHPKAKLVGKITNNSNIDYNKDGTYQANIKGEMTIKGVTKTVEEKGSITVNGKAIHIKSKFNLRLADYNVAFEKGKPASNIAKTVEITVEADYLSE